MISLNSGEVLWLQKGLVAGSPKVLHSSDLGHQFGCPPKKAWLPSPTVTSHKA